MTQMAMDDEAYAKSADALQERLQGCADRQTELARIFAERDIVFGLYPDPESITRWDKYMMKGADRLQTIDRCTVACLWCRSIEEAMSMARRFGDGAGPASD